MKFLKQKLFPQTQDERMDAIGFWVFVAFTGFAVSQIAGLIGLLSK